MNQNTFFLSARQKIHTFCVPVFFHGDDIVISHLFICNFEYFLMTFYGIDELVCEVYRLDSPGSCIESRLHHRFVCDLEWTVTYITDLTPAYHHLEAVVCDGPPAAMPRPSG